MPQTLTACWVFPVSGPPLANGTVTVEGDRLEAVLPHGARTPDEDLGNVALIPGLVNPHTHLDLSGARGLIPPTDPDRFTDWLRGVIAFRRTRSPEQTQADIQDGLAECLSYGTTLIGDIASEGASWDALAAAPMRAVVFHEVLGLSAERAGRAIQRLTAWDHRTPDTERCRKGVSPHAPYSARASLIRSVRRPNRPIAIHLAESRAEIELIARQTGPFVPFLTDLGVWEPSGLLRNLEKPSEWYAQAGPTLFVHCNYSPRQIFGVLTERSSVVYCPRTHAAFGHPPHPFFGNAAFRVCLGTDSLASNPDLDILAEARFVRERYPDFPGAQLLRMVTLSGAEALGWADEVGSLDPGKSADLVAVPLPDAERADPHELLLANHPGPRRTMFRGQWRL